MKFSEIRQLPTLNGKLQHWNQQQNLPSNSSHAELPDQALPDINGKLLNWFRNHNLPPIPGSCQFLMVNYYSEISIIIYHQIQARSCPNPMVNYVWYFRKVRIKGRKLEISTPKSALKSRRLATFCVKIAEKWPKIATFPKSRKFPQKSHAIFAKIFSPAYPPTSRNWR